MSLIDVLTNEEEERYRMRRIHGVAVGIVTQNRDPEGLGRVRISLPWLSEESESDWVKVMTFMAGNDWGGFFLPEVEDEVLVAFEHGDINHPYVLGGLWNSEDRPPESNADGSNNVRKIRSRSGHEVVFQDDTPGGQEKLELRSKAGHTVVLSDAAGREKIEVRDKTGNNVIVLDSVQNTISVESAMKLTLKGQIVEIEAGASMTVKAGATLTIQGTLVRIN